MTKVKNVGLYSEREDIYHSRTFIRNCKFLLLFRTVGPIDQDTCSRLSWNVAKQTSFPLVASVAQLVHFPRTHVRWCTSANSPRPTTAATAVAAALPWCVCRMSGSLFPGTNRMKLTVFLVTFAVITRTCYQKEVSDQCKFKTSSLVSAVRLVLVELIDKI